jgi:DeoR-like helix-turn-helix domain
MYANAYGFKARFSRQSDQRQESFQDRSTREVRVPVRYGHHCPHPSCRRAAAGRHRIWPAGMGSRMHHRVVRGAAGSPPPAPRRIGRAAHSPIIGTWLVDRLRQGRLVATELASELGVSEDTISRDLRDLAVDGRLVRVHGGALPASLTCGLWRSALPCRPKRRCASGGRAPC